MDQKFIGMFVIPTPSLDNPDAEKVLRQLWQVQTILEWVAT